MQQALLLRARAPLARVCARPRAPGARARGAARAAGFVISL